MFKRFKGRYTERKNKKSDRDVMSYEDMPLDDYELEKTEISPAAVKKIIISVGIVLVAGLVVLAFANRDKLTWDNLSNWWTYEVVGNAGSGYPATIVGTEVKAGNFDVTQGRVAYTSDTSFVTLNSSASVVQNMQLQYSKPVLRTAGGKYLTYGIGNKGFMINSYNALAYSGETDDNIFTGDIASNGVYALVTEGNGYLSTLLVYNSGNNRVYKYSFSEYYITALTLNSDGSGCVASGITSDNGAMSTGVYVLDFTKEEPVSLYTIKNDSVTGCKYIGGNRIALVGQTASYLVTIGAEDYVTNSYEDKTLANYNFNADTGTYTVALSKSGDGRSCMLVTYNNKGEEKSRIDTNYDADSLSTYKNTIGVLDGNTAYLYNTDGRLIYKCDVGTGSKKMLLTSDSTAYVLSVNQIRYIDFKNPSTADTVESTR